MKAYMGLGCKSGSFMTIFKALMRKFVDQYDIFLMFGPVDIIVRFNNLKSVEEFKKEWFDPIRMIGSEKELITETLTLITITEGPDLVEKPFAFIFLNTKPKDLETVRSKLVTIPEVLSADTVFGPYDVLCSVKAEDTAELETLVSLIQQIEGVESLITSIVAANNILPDY
ncbi:MAG: Lrp/AsnC ligand binding domain-containing protein [Candidatus Bathyarchaeota archaeon]|nr:Lrp/AsnC ligand binding domain-containing protein [Candidatus Bathyarchaeota archaeon]